MSEVDTENMFADVDTEAEVLGQMVGAGSTCWDKLGDSGVFDAEFAVQVVKHGQARLKEIRNKETFKTLTKGWPQRHSFVNELVDDMDVRNKAEYGLRKYLLFGPRRWVGGSVAVAGRTLFWGTHRSERADGKRWTVTFR